MSIIWANISTLLTPFDLVWKSNKKTGSIRELNKLNKLQPALFTGDSPTTCQVFSSFSFLSTSQKIISHQIVFASIKKQNNSVWNYIRNIQGINKFC